MDNRYEPIAKPTKAQIKKFLNKEFPHINIDGIQFVETKSDRLWFQCYSFGRLIGQSDECLIQDYWERVRKHLKWCWG